VKTTNREDVSLAVLLNFPVHTFFIFKISQFNSKFTTVQFTVHSTLIYLHSTVGKL